jgi:pimeloyl-ACP methyl ester carboxylesterase
MSMQTKKADTTFVLVHGAWHGAWAWTGVVTELERLGHRAFAPTIRGHGPGEDRHGVTQEDFVASLVDFVNSRDLTSVVLVAHSWGGYVVAPAVPLLAPRLAGVVFLSALVPLDGQSMFDANLPEVSAEYRRLSAERPDGSIPMTWERFRGWLMQEAPEEVARVVHRLLTPVPLETFSGIPRTAGFSEVDIPRLFVYGRNDIAMPRSAWEDFAGRIGPHSVAEVDGDHESMFLHPEEIAKVLDGFVSAFTGES